MIEELEWMQRRIEEMATIVTAQRNYWADEFGDCSDEYEAKLERARAEIRLAQKAVNQL